MTEPATVWGEFETGARALAAARALRAAGHVRVSAFTPYPMPELEEILGLERPRLLLGLVLAGACVGGGLAFLLIWWTAAVSYPLNVGGRPLNSFVADIPLLFESAVLSAALTAFATTLLFSGMPRLNHPLDSLPGFERTTIDRFWLGVAASSSADTEPVAHLFEELGARRIHRPGALP